MTAKQKQHLLGYLGYYQGEVDGKWGRMSLEATEGFQRAHGLKADGVFGGLTEAKILEVIAGGITPPMEESTGGEAQEGGTFWDEIKYFTREEFRCRCGGKYCDGFPAEIDERLVRLADRVREHFGAPVYISSGVRCEQHNANVGGVAGSRHKLGKAMDFRVAGFSSGMVLAYVQTLPGVRYAYAIDGSYVHMDVE